MPTTTRNSSLPEYLHVFGEDGPVTVHVQFASGQRSMPDRHIRAEDMDWLISADGQRFLQELSFDEWVLPIERIEIDPAGQRLTLHVNDRQDA